MKRFVLALVLGAAVGLPLAAPAAAPTPGPLSTAAQPTCAAGDPVVWINTSSKVFHDSTSPWFGRTKRGSYACKSQAIAQGATAPGTRGASNGMSPSKHHKKGAGGAMPAPSPSP